MQKVPTNTVTRNLSDFSAQTDNMYESVIAISKRANEISNEMLSTLQKKLNEFSAAQNDNLEETFENREQIEISAYFEKLPKPTILATEEYLHGELEIHM